MALIKLSSKERVNIIELLERQIRMAEKALNTPIIRDNNYDDFKNQINNNNITIIKLRNENSVRIFRRSNKL